MMELSRDRRYRLVEDHRQTRQGNEQIILKGEIVIALREQIDYVKGTHKVQVKTTSREFLEPVVAWVTRKKLRPIR